MHSLSRFAMLGLMMTGVLAAPKVFVLSQLVQGKRSQGHM